MTCDLLRPSRRDGETPGEAFPYSQGRQTAVVTASLPGNRPAGRADTAVPGPTSRDLLVIEHGSDRIGERRGRGQRRSIRDQKHAQGTATKLPAPWSVIVQTRTSLSSGPGSF